MYQGNMKDFVEKVSEYTEKRYGFTISMYVTEVWEKGSDGKYYVCGYADFIEDSERWVDERVFDREDFEQQVYKIVNDVIKAGDYV